MRHTFRIAALAILLATGIASPAAAQYMFLDSDGDGIHTAADVMGAAGTPTTVKIYLKTDQNRDGSQAFCNTGDGDLTLNGYGISLRASDLVNFGAYTNGQSSMVAEQPEQRTPTEFVAKFRKQSFPHLPPGTYLLGTVMITSMRDNTTIEIVNRASFSAEITGFSTQCSGNDFDNYYKLYGDGWGSDWFDADGLGPGAGGGGGEAPSIDPIPNQTVDEGALLALTVTASDPESDPLTFYLASGAPAGASITPEGAFTWVPDEAQGGFTHSITVNVTDGTTPAGTSFQVTVNKANSPPTVLPIDDRTFSERVHETFQVTATDPDVPLDTITYSLVSAPPGATITPDGIFSWIATEEQGPGSYPIIVRAEDGTPGSFDDEEFVAHVTEFNLEPVLAPIPDQTVNEGATVSLTVTATDADLPAQTLEYGLLGAPLGGSKVETTMELAELLLEQIEIAVVPGEAFGSPGYCRFSFALGDDDMVEGLTRLQELVNSQ